MGYSSGHFQPLIGQGYCVSGGLVTLAHLPSAVSGRKRESLGEGLVNSFAYCRAQLVIPNDYKGL